MADVEPSRFSLPIPDPTLLTTEQLRRELLNLRELVEARLARTEDISSLAVSNLRELFAERFTRVDTLFVEGDKRTQQLSAANSLALAAALQAAKEAVGEQNRSSALAIAKSEAATAESILQLRNLFETANRATNEKIDDFKSRLDKREGGSTAWVVAAGLVFLGFSVIVAVVTLVLHPGH